MLDTFQISYSSGLYRQNILQTMVFFFYISDVLHTLTVCSSSFYSHKHIPNSVLYRPFPRPGIDGLFV